MSTATKSQLLCTRCGNGFNNNNNPFLMTCTDCHQYDVDYTINLGNQIRILQINVALMNISFESKIYLFIKQVVLRSGLFVIPSHNIVPPQSCLLVIYAYFSHDVL